MRAQSLHHHWEFHQADNPLMPWLPAQVPGHVHVDLMENGAIPDPFDRMQEVGVQWVDETDWEYRTTFSQVPLEPGERAILRFDGLDSVATITLNGEKVAESNSMFVPLEIELTGRMKEENELHIRFRGPRPIGRERQAAYFKEQGLQADTARLEELAFVRKAQYMYGWDWGPRLASCGIWLPVNVLVFTGRILDVWAQQEHREDGSVFIHLKSQIEGKGSVRHRLLTPDGDELTLEDGDGQILIKNPDLWWPNGQGDQPLYDLISELVDEGEVLDVQVQNIGLRTIQLRREPDQHGESFEFIVNGRPVYAFGANWIPDHSFPSQVTREDLEAQIWNAVAMNINMLRVWGGGIFVSDDFLDLCDQHGIMVWQDFPYACSYYPDTDPWREIATAEAEAQVPRFRNHACLALWCGNNENSMMRDDGWGGKDKQPARFHGEVLWEVTIPDALNKLDPGRPYINSSPTGGTPNNCGGFGDSHYWDVWHGRGDWIHYQDSTARFSSEFGFASSPSMEVWEDILDEEEAHPRSPVVKWHDKTGKGYDTYLSYTELHYPKIETLDDLVYYTQLNQRDAMRFALTHYRTSDFCRGTLIWQLNDCWPVQSWALVDCYKTPKAAGEEMARCFEGGLVAVKVLNGHIEVWAINDSPESIAGPVNARFLSTVSGEEVASYNEASVVLAPNSRRKVLEWSRAELPEGSLLIEADWSDLEPCIQLLQEPKDTQFGVSRLVAEVAGEDAVFLRVEGAPVVDLMLRSDDTACRWLSVLPGRPVFIGSSDLDAISARSLAGEHVIVPRK